MIADVDKALDELSDHIPDKFKDFLDNNPKLALEKPEKAAEELLARFYHA
ncbi:hypothetical protein AGMMS50267_06120 [Spirochaetia bacterium]|nr:hypothetical protein AGMMS50267_06120 [Spirochaetia bacterium]